MAVLTGNGIDFGVGGVLNSKYGIIPQSVPMIFISTTAPTGWTQVTTQNDKCLRVVNNTTTGGTSAGTNTFSTTLATQPVSATVPVTINGFSSGGTSLSTNTIPIHSHTLNSGGNIACSGTTPSQPVAAPGAAPGTTTGNYGNGGSHSHPINYTSASGPGSSSIDFRVQYVDCIICTLN
jgi:hypothetical protein